MRLPIAEQSRYPKATRYIRFTLPYVARMPAIVYAVQKCGQLGQQAFAAALAWESDPDISIVTMAPCGRFSPKPGSNIIEINRLVFDEFETGRGSQVAPNSPLPALGINILHELVHWGDNLDGIDRPSEESDELEMLFHGVSIGC